MNNLRISPERDIPLMAFLWKWKCVTTAALSAKFFAKDTFTAAYKRLWQLEGGGFIKAKAISEDGRNFVWTLDRKGFACIQHSLPVLREEGYKAEHLGHDLLVSAFHLGDFLFEKPPSVTLMSEQQLRRYDFEFFPSRIPANELHRSDGYTIISHSDQKKVVAIEVELVTKKKADYECVGDFYEDAAVDHVLWLVPRESLANRIHGIISACRHIKKEKHSFTLLDDFKRVGWDAKIFCGLRKDSSIRNIMGNNPETCQEHVSAKFLLDTRKAPHRSATSRIFEIPKILD